MRRIFIIIILLTWSFYGNAQNYDLHINEFMADNNSTIEDETDNKYDDWLEIYNAGNAVINLEGYYLTDDLSQPDKWAFPNVQIDAGGYLLVWADSDSGDVGLHANFKLSKDGDEFLGMFYKSGNNLIAVDTFTFDQQEEDISYGRFPDGSSNWMSMDIPTPGASNTDESAPDPSDALFDESVVHNFKLTFYVVNWAEQLEYNYENGNVYMPARLEYNGIILDSIGVRYKGNSSYRMAQNTPKKPFKLNFDKYIDGQNLCGLKELNFSNCAKDPSFVREIIGYDIIRQYVPAPRAAYANIYVGNELIGLYVEVEQVDKVFLSRYYDDNDFNLYKAGDNGATLQYKGDSQSLYENDFELKTNESLNDWSGLVDLIKQMNYASSSNFNLEMADYLDLDMACRHLALNMALSNFDSYTGSGRNYYLYDDSTSGKFQIIHWDLNECFGAFNNQWNVITQDVLESSNLSQRPLVKKIVENETLRNLYLSYIKEIIEGPASYNLVSIKAEQLAGLADPYVQADGNKLYTYQNFLNNLDNSVFAGQGDQIPGVKSFTQQRIDNLESQLSVYLVTNVDNDVPDIYNYSLSQNYPNPFNPSTNIEFSLAEDSYVELAVYNIIGEKVATLVNQYVRSGNHKATWIADYMPSGIYLYSLNTPNYRVMKKMILLR